MRGLLGTLRISGTEYSEDQKAGQNRLKAPGAGRAHALIQPVCGSKGCSEAGRVHLQCTPQSDNDAVILHTMRHLLMPSKGITCRA